MPHMPCAALRQKRNRSNCHWKRFTRRFNNSFKLLNYKAMYLYTISHASFKPGLLYNDCTNASTKFLIRWCMRIFLLSTLLTLNLLLAGKDSKSQNLDKVIISLNVKDATLKQVFNKIEKQTSFHFTYRSDDVRRIKAITYTGDNVSLAKVLNDLLQNTGLRYEEI